MAPPARTITVALDMSKAFDTMNIHTLIRKLLQTNIPGTIIKFIANYIMGCKAYTTYRNHTSKQRQIKTGVPQGGVLSPTLQHLHHPVHSGGSPMFPLVVHQSASPFIWPAVQSLRRGLSTNPWVTMWCVCG